MRIPKVMIAAVLLLSVLCSCQTKPTTDTETTGAKTTETNATEPTPQDSTESDGKDPAAPGITLLRPGILEKGKLVSRVSEGKLNYQAWPTVCQDEKGVLYVVDSLRLTHIDPFGKNCLYKSTDGGKTWSEGVVINDSPLDDRDAGLLYIGNGKMVMTYFCHPTSYYLERETHWQKFVTEEEKQALIDRWNKLTTEERRGGSYVRVSEDYGKTWCDPIRVPVSSPHGPTLLENGNLLYVGTICNWLASDDPDGTAYDYGVYAFVSEDGGYTWKYHSRIRFFGKDRDADFHEPYAIQLKNGRILVTIRADGEKFPGKLSTYTCYSDNGGKKWSKPKIVCDDFIGAPAHLLQLNNGAVIMTYGRRVNRDNNPCGIRGRISYDNGLTFGEEFRIDTPRDPEDSDLGYPSTVQLADGSLYTVYYQHHFTDRYPSILYTRWELNPVE